MTKRKHTPANSAELRERGVRLFQENRADHASDNAAYKAIAPKLGCSPDSLRGWCRQAERDCGRREKLTTAEKDRIKALERELRELRTANERQHILPPLVTLLRKTLPGRGTELDRSFRK